MFSTVADLRCWKMCCIPSAAGAASQPSRRKAPRSDLVLGKSSTRCSIKRSPTPEGDKVVVHDRFGGTHRGDLFGHPGTGDRIEWMAIHIYTIRDGKILEDAVMADALAIMQQLGLAPSA